MNIHKGLAIVQQPVSCGRPKGTGRLEHRSIPHAPTQSGTCIPQGMGGVRQAVLPLSIHGKSGCVNAHVRICAGAISNGRPYRETYPLGRVVAFSDKWFPVVPVKRGFGKLQPNYCRKRDFRGWSLGASAKGISKQMGVSQD